MSSTVARIRLGAVALAAAGVLFVLYPAVRPWKDESTTDGAGAAMSSGAWVASHLFAMMGFILVPLGLLALRTVVARTPTEPIAAASVVTSWIGAGLTLPYYGAEDFGLHAIATEAAQGQPLDLLALVDAVRFKPVAVTTLLVGLLLLAGRDLALRCAAALQRHPVRARPRPVPPAVLHTSRGPHRTRRTARRPGHLAGAGAWQARTVHAPLNSPR